MMRSVRTVWLAGLCLGMVLAGIAVDAADDQPGTGLLQLHARTRVETGQGSGRYRAVERTLAWDPRRTAVVICDMWDEHWCPGATARVAEMAPHMNEVVQAARKQGMLIIHCPSGTMEFYKDSPQRNRAQQAPAAKPKVPLQRWCKLDPAREAPLPIDDSDEGCDSHPDMKPRKAWGRQIAAIEIAAEDAITDSDEAYNLLEQRGIDNLIVMGVHANMCVLGRPFSIRQMVYQGKNVVLMRDMTDTMYNPASKPYVSHFTGNDLVVEHIEKFWCPSITSADFLGGNPFRFAADKRPHLVVITSEPEYQTEQTLPEFALSELGRDLRVSFVFGSPLQDENELPGLEVLHDADALLLSVRRRLLLPAELEIFRKYLAAGKPLVAIRTASHPFCLFDKPPSAGRVEWREFDREILGCHYRGHHGERKGSPSSLIRVADASQAHPLLAGVSPAEFPAGSTLYKSQPLAASTTLLMVGRIDDTTPVEPVAWTNSRADGGKVFYTSMGHPDDFQRPEFRRLLKNGVLWSAGLAIPQAEEAAAGCK